VTADDRDFLVVLARMGHRRQPWPCKPALGQTHRRLRLVRVGGRVHPLVGLPGTNHGVIAIAREGVAATLISFPALLVALLVALLIGVTAPELVPT
jgi:hypothetical protein